MEVIKQNQAAVIQNTVNKPKAEFTPKPPTTANKKPSSGPKPNNKKPVKIQAVEKVRFKNGKK
jgi:hypothetical protein